MHRTDAPKEVSEATKTCRLRGRIQTHHQVSCGHHQPKGERYALAANQKQLAEHAMTKFEVAYKRDGK